MPRDLTHVILADEAVSKLDKPLADLLSKEKTAYHMGAISHDSFLYGPSPKLSTKMHGGLGDDTRVVVLAMLDDVRQEKNPEIANRKKAFACGFMSHMAVDTVFHPFVYSLSGSQVRENNPTDEDVRLAKARHRYTETWLDMHFVDQKGLNFDNFRPLRKIVHDVDQKKMLTDFFCKNYQQAYKMPKDVSQDFKKGMTMQLFLGKMTRNQTVGKVLRRIDNLLDGKLKLAVSGFYQKDRKIPDQIIKFQSFNHPVTGEKVSKSMDDLACDSIDRAAYLISCAQDYLANGNKQEFMLAVSNANLDTGVINTKLADIKKAKPININDLKGKKFSDFMAVGNVKTMPSGAKNEAIRNTIIRKNVKGRG